MDEIIGNLLFRITGKSWEYLAQAILHPINDKPLCDEILRLYRVTYWTNLYYENPELYWYCVKKFDIIF